MKNLNILTKICENQLSSVSVYVIPLLNDHVKGQSKEIMFRNLRGDPIESCLTSLSPLVNKYGFTSTKDYKNYDGVNPVFIMNCSKLPKGYAVKIDVKFPNSGLAKLLIDRIMTNFPKSVE